MKMNRREFVAKRREMANKPIEELIETLSSGNLQIRFLAEMCLRDATSTWLDFQPASSPEEREKSIERWREWLKEREGKFKKRLKRSKSGKVKEWKSKW